MAVPFRRVSSTRRDKRRTHDKLSAPAVVKCPECGFDVDVPEELKEILFFCFISINFLSECGL